MMGFAEAGRALSLPLSLSLSSSLLHADNNPDHSPPLLLLTLPSSHCQVCLHSTLNTSLVSLYKGPSVSVSKLFL